MALTDSTPMKPETPMPPTEEPDPAERKRRRFALRISSEEAVGADVLSEAALERDNVRDLIIESETGRIIAVILESGSIHPFRAFRWDSQSRHLRLKRDLPNAWPLTARQILSDAQEPPRTFSIRKRSHAPKTLLWSTLEGSSLVGHEYASRSLQEMPLGDIDSAVVDFETGFVPFIAVQLNTLVETLPTQHRDPRALPWSSMRVRRNHEGDPELATWISSRRLKQAPTLPESGSSTPNLPRWRAILEHYGLQAGPNSGATRFRLHE